MTTHPYYQSVVERAWENNSPYSVTTLNQVRNESLIFNSEVFGNIQKRKIILEKRIKGIQLSLEMVYSARLVYLKQELQQEYDRVLFQEELHWYQWSKEKWIKCED